MFEFFLILGFIAAWIIIYFAIIRPKLESFRYTAGIYKQFNAYEAKGAAKAALWLKGLKVAIVGFITSSAPVVAASWDKITGFDWSTVFPNEHAKIIAAAVAVAGVLGPMVMVGLHIGALADASATEPVKD